MELLQIQQKIYEIRGQKIMLDFDLAELYEVQTKRLNEQVKRNITRFPYDFMFQLTQQEWNLIRSQNATASDGDKIIQSQNATASQMKRNVSALPYAFTEQGVAMLSGILKSEIAINVNIAIMRAFVFMRQYAISHKDLTEKLNELEIKYDKQFGDVYQALNFLIKKDKLQSDQENRKRIGFKREDGNE